MLAPLIVMLLMPLPRFRARFWPMLAEVMLTVSCPAPVMTERKLPTVLLLMLTLAEALDPKLRLAKPFTEEPFVMLNASAGTAEALPELFSKRLPPIIVWLRDTLLPPRPSAVAK